MEGDVTVSTSDFDDTLVEFTFEMKDGSIRKEKWNGKGDFLVPAGTRLIHTAYPAINNSVSVEITLGN